MLMMTWNNGKHVVCGSPESLLSLYRCIDHEEVWTEFKFFDSWGNELAFDWKTEKLDPIKLKE